MQGNDARAQSQQHERFLTRLRASSDAVLRVASWLHRLGKTVEISALTYAPTAADAVKHIDDGDLFVIRREAVEVKHLGVSFTSREDWPFREVFVANRASVERKEGRVMAYVSLNKEMTHAAVIKATTRKHWYLTAVRASNTGNEEQFFACPLEYVWFTALADN